MTYDLFAEDNLDSLFNEEFESNAGTPDVDGDGDELEKKRCGGKGCGKKGKKLKFDLFDDDDFSANEPGSTMNPEDPEESNDIPEPSEQRKKAKKGKKLKFDLFDDDDDAPKDDDDAPKDDDDAPKDDDDDDDAPKDDDDDAPKDDDDAPKDDDDDDDAPKDDDDDDDEELDRRKGKKKSNKMKYDFFEDDLFCLL